LAFRAFCERGFEHAVQGPGLTFITFAGHDTHRRSESGLTTTQHSGLKFTESHEVQRTAYGSEPFTFVPGHELSLGALELMLDHATELAEPAIGRLGIEELVQRLAETTGRHGHGLWNTALCGRWGLGSGPGAPPAGKEAGREHQPKHGP
jgi:hypothetical protein